MINDGYFIDAELMELMERMALMESMDGKSFKMQLTFPYDFDEYRIE